MNFGNYKMLSVHTTNARLIKNFRSSLEEFQAEVRNAGLEERMHIMCSMERDTYTQNFQTETQKENQ